MTKEQAIALYGSNFWEAMSARERVEFQLFEDRLCMPFAVFHKAIEEILGRPVWTHEFAFRELLIKEFLGDRPRPSFEDICNLIPKDKRIILEI